jgi:O-antigen/teichoic acid export membrane protein
MPPENIQPQMPDSAANPDPDSAFNKLVSFAEGLFKTDLRYLIPGLSWSTLAQIFASGSAFVLSLFISRLVSKDIYGEYKYVLAIITILSTLSLNNIGGAVFQSVARGYDGAFAEGFKENIKWSAAIFCGAFAFGAYYLFLGNYVLGIGILIGGCITPFLTSANLYNSYLLGKKDFKGQAWFGDVVTNIIPVIALIITVYVAPRPLPLIIVYFVSNFVAALYAYIRTVQRYRPDSAKRDPEMLTYGKHLSAIGVLNGIAGNLDQILLFHFSSAAELAVYNFSIGILDQTKGPLKTLDSMMQARFAPQDDASIRSGMFNKYIWIFAASLVTIIVYIPLAPYIYKILFPAYLEAVPYSQVYAISLLSLALTPVSSYLSAKKRIRAQYISTTLNSLFQIVTVAVGTIVWGLWGLIIARVITRFATNIINLVTYLFTPAE